MQNETWLLGPLLWNVAQYWQVYGDVSADGKGLFSHVFADEPALDLFAAAIERNEENDAGLLMREAHSLAMGTPPSDFSRPQQIPVLAAILSRVRLEQDDDIPIKYFGLPDPPVQDAFHIAIGETATLREPALKKHLSAFMDELRYLKTLDCHKKTEMVLALVEKYFWCLPAPGMLEGTDIALFALARMAAAITSCWQKPAEGLPVVPDRSQPGYTLIQGDLSGIQNYIYRISSAKGAAKGLKGRSFELGLLTGIVIKHLLRKFELTGANVIYNGGGKFYMLAPAVAHSQIEALHAAFEEKFYARFDGEIFLGLAGIQLTGNDFSTESFAQKWQDVADACDATKQRKFASLIAKNYGAVFQPNDAGQAKPTCDACRREETDGEKLIPKDQGTPTARDICPRCESMEKAGRLLARAKYLVEIINEQPAGKWAGDKKIAYLAPPSPGISHYIVAKEKLPAFKGEVVTYYRFETPKFDSNFPLAEQLKQPEVQCGFRFYGGKDLPYNDTGEPAEYDELAQKSDGLKRLGVLRMDVDNLGQVFRRGLGEYDGKALRRNNAPPARMLTLSWQINLFFSHQLNRLRAKEKFRDHVFVIYSGGDDLFIVGSWNRVLDFAVDIQKAFCDFAHNPQLTISGGIAIVPRKFPIHKAADFSGQAEDAAKDFNFGAKNAFTFLDKPLGWYDFEVAKSICYALKDAIEPPEGSELPKLNKGIIDRLRRIYTLYDENRRRKDRLLKDKNTIPQIEDYLKMLRYDKWRWMLTYSLQRFRDNNAKHKKLIDRLQMALLKNQWHEQYTNQRDIIDFIDVPTRWVEFLTRKERD